MTNRFNERWLKHRHRREACFRLYGQLAIGFAFVILLFLVGSIVRNGYSGFMHTTISLPITFSSENLGLRTLDTEALKQADYKLLIHRAMETAFPDATERRDKRRVMQLISTGASYQLKRELEKHPEWRGTTQVIPLLSSSDVDMYWKGKTSRLTAEADRRLKDQQIRWLDRLQERGAIALNFNRELLLYGDSREPETAGVLTSLVGSLLTIFACLLVAFPLGVVTAVYLEEFAPKTKLVTWIEININNLAAVPSIIFGLLGLAIYINIFGLPRSSPLVGGLTLALMILPVIIITTRASLRAVSPSIRNAALGIGASPMQVVLHHTLPLALPGIMTGTILGISRALGETAPLLMIGMVAFVADVPRGLTDPATTLPVQIYLWADSPELGFSEKTSACILVLLGLLTLLNATAVWLRTKTERRW